LSPSLRTWKPILLCTCPKDQQWLFLHSVLAPWSPSWAIHFICILIFVFMFLALFFGIWVSQCCDLEPSMNLDQQLCLFRQRPIYTIGNLPSKSHGQIVVVEPRKGWGESVPLGLLISGFSVFFFCF
jgi:hypothetical protein